MNGALSIRFDDQTDIYLGVNNVATLGIRGQLCAEYCREFTSCGECTSDDKCAFVDGQGCIAKFELQQQLDSSSDNLCALSPLPSSLMFSLAF